MRVAYRHVRPVSVVYARGTGHYQAATLEAWKRLNCWLEGLGARRHIKRALGIFHDNPQTTDPELLRYDACVDAGPSLDADPTARIGRQMLSGGTYAVHTHIGSYGPIGNLLSRLHRESVPRQGLTVDYDRPFLTIHLNDPVLTREIHRRTELCIPVLPLKLSVPAERGGEDAYLTATLARKAVGLR